MIAGTEPNVDSPIQIPIPKRIAKLPVDKRGYPVPFFVAKDDRGEWDFRMMDGRKLHRCVVDRLCWICGEPLGRYLCFAIGPMCAINRTSAEPPGHKECMEFSARVCPFLTNPDQKRNMRKVHGEAHEPGGHSIKRNPGVTLTWVCESYDVYRDNFTNGTLFRIHDPVSLSFWREGRPAQRHEVIESIESGLPILLKMAEDEGPSAVEALYKQRAAAYKLLPSDGDGLQTEERVDAGAPGCPGRDADHEGA